MTDTTGDTTHRATSRDTDTTHRVSVHEASRVLGITPDSVRARLRRGTLPGERVAGNWYVDLPDIATVDTTSRDGHRDDDTMHRAMRHDTDTTSRDALVTSLEARIADKDDQIAYLRSLVTDQARALEERSRELATERERSDVLQQLALSRIPAVAAGPLQEPPSDAPERAGATIESPMADDPFIADSASQDVSAPSDELTAQWTDLARQLIEELGMTPAAARIAAAQELGLAG